jgi:hypothetical protein
VRDDFDMDFSCTLAFEEVGCGIRHVAAERFERIPFHMQPFDIGAFHISDLCVFIEGRFSNCNVHWNLSPPLYHVRSPHAFEAPQWRAQGRQRERPLERRQHFASAAARNLYKRAIRDHVIAQFRVATDLDDIPVRPSC